MAKAEQQLARRIEDQEALSEALVRLLATKGITRLDVERMKAVVAQERQRG